ncbi:MAG TPA: RnfABCDGE type electron transport complex subunit B [Nevskiaceae bacterium]|nr:RnfABCDGE type electron transport complex subunit B [Nevskiaceae bacterium]
MSLPSDSIDALLPQTQCTRCGYADCRAYATAIAAGDAAINRCPPGGAPVIAALAQLLERPVVPLDAECGEEETTPFVAFVREAECIGCYKCAQVCPVDAFVGAPKYLHTVIEAECTGCELCLPVCPVDCIELHPRRVDVELARSRADHSRRRYAARNARMERLRRQREAQRLSRQSAVARERRIAGYLDAARQRTAQRQRPPRPSTP